MKIRDKELYLNKFWKHLVSVKIVKIRHLNSHISYISQKKKYFFFVKMNTIMLLIMYQIFSSLLGHLPFSVHFFLHFYETTFLGHPIWITTWLNSYWIWCWDQYDMALYSNKNWGKFMKTAWEGDGKLFLDLL